MFSPTLGRVSVQNDCASPGAWAQLHPDNKLNMIAAAIRHLITNMFSCDPVPAGKKKNTRIIWLQSELTYTRKLKA